MPKYGIHSMVMSEAAVAAPAEIKNLLQQHRGAALLGAVGPDLLFFSPEYGAFNFFVQLAHNLKGVKEAFGKVVRTIEDVIEPIEEAIEELAEPIDEAVETVEKLLPMECASGLVGEVKSAASTFEKSIHEVLLVGLDEGIDMVSDAADLPEFSHRLFDELFTPKHQQGRREWDWYWFDMLHYRNTGLFAKNLVKLATSDIQKAYALGYLTHVATDTVGHAFVNRIVCGPYRLHPQRHVVIENFMDSYQYYKRYGISVNKGLYSDLLDNLKDDGVCQVDEYSGHVQSFNSEIRDLLYQAFLDSYPHSPTTSTDSRPPRPEFLSPDDIVTTFENFHVVMSYLRDAHLEKPAGLDERYRQVADTLNEILSQFQPPPSPPAIGNSGFCLEWECVLNFFETIHDWMAYFAELVQWTIDTIVNALDLLLEMFCEASIAVVRAIMYLTEYLSYELYQRMYFVLALNGYVTPEPTHATDDPRGEALVHTALTADTLVEDCATTECHDPAYPRQHDCLQPAVKPPVAPVETPATPFPRYDQDDYPEWFITQAPWNDIEQAVKAYAEADTPANTRALASADNPQTVSLGNAVHFAGWMMEKALEVRAFEDASGRMHELSHVVHCNWDLDADRGYGYKQWFTSKNPATEHDLADERYLREDLSRD